MLYRVVYAFLRRRVRKEIACPEVGALYSVRSTPYSVIVFRYDKDSAALSDGCVSLDRGLLHVTLLVGFP